MKIWFESDALTVKQALKKGGIDPASYYDFELVYLDGKPFQLLAFYDALKIEGRLMDLKQEDNELVCYHIHCDNQSQLRRYVIKQVKEMVRLEKEYPWG